MIEMAPAWELSPVLSSRSLEVPATLLPDCTRVSFDDKMSIFPEYKTPFPVLNITAPPTSAPLPAVINTIPDSTLDDVPAVTTWFLSPYFILRSPDWVKLLPVSTEMAPDAEEGPVTKLTEPAVSDCIDMLPPVSPELRPAARYTCPAD